MITVTRKFEFDFAHYLPGYEGKCCRMHGHRGVLEIEIDGYDGRFGVSPVSGFILDFTILDKIVKENIIEEFDHHTLNDYFPMPTAENIVQFVFEQLTRKTELAGHIVRIRFYETPNSYAELKW